MNQVDRPRAALNDAHPPKAATSPRIYYVHPLLAGQLESWGPLLDRIAGMGFTHVLSAPLFEGADLFRVQDFDRPHAALGWGGDAVSALRHAADLCSDRGLSFLLDVELDRVSAESRVAADRPDLFARHDGGRVLDPRTFASKGDAAAAQFRTAPEAVASWWGERLRIWRDAGVEGFRFVALNTVPPSVLREIGDAARVDRSCLLLAGTAGLSLDERHALRGAGLDFVFSSLPWWDFEADWLWDELAVLRTIAPIIAAPEEPFGLRLAQRVLDPEQLRPALTRAARMAVALGDGWLMPMGYEHAASLPMDAHRDTPADLRQEPGFDLSAVIADLNAGAFPPGLPRLVTGPGAGLIAFVRADADLRVARAGTLTVANSRLDAAMPFSMDRLLALMGGGFAVAANDGGELTELPPGGVLSFALAAAAPIRQSRPPLADSALAAASPDRRLGIERVSPVVEDGRFPAKRIAGEVVTIACDVICDGHDQLSAAVLWRGCDEEDWQEAPMRLAGNDRWEASLALPRVGRYVFAIEAWHDAFETFRDELRKKHAAGIDVHLELIEGRQLLEMATLRAGGRLAATLDALSRAEPAAAVALLLAPELATVMREADDRVFAVRTRDYAIEADRVAARFASWYEIFPRSMSDDETRHGTFRDVVRHLPRIREMGFDVLYFPPIHPIGRKNRKGRNNTLTPAPDDPGSPYAIGSDEGGHDAIHPQLGTLEDFLHLRDAAMAEGLEIALDFAIQCSPDHPWLKTHKGWFDWRPDGSLRYAENPPKKYEDIVNVDFYSPDAVPSLWVALAETVLFWADQGVRTFRVDNPHTKSFAFWEWMIAEVRAEYPDALFLAEAFTRPKIMNRLGKIGFSQSYTYFTWRNTKAELQEYLTELTTTEQVDFFRPNFFVNTPDINPIPLQISGRAGFLIRAALAATLSGLWGVYCGFELCEGTPVPGREEYLNSEKYQLRAWDWDRPGNIVREITALNRIRRLNPALHTHLGVSFLPADNDQVMFYEKATADRSNVVLVAVSLDPARPQTTAIELPMWKWGIPDQGSLPVDDLVRNEPITWRSKWQRVTLDPGQPYAIWRARPIS